MKVETIVGVAGAGKTTMIANRLKEELFKNQEEFVFTSLTNATLKAFFRKMETIKQKQYSIRTIYGLALKELKLHGYYNDDKSRLLSKAWKVRKDVTLEGTRIKSTVKVDNDYVWQSDLKTKKNYND
jgi:deoxyadenosine/deoxycytidine kinase